jgi:aminopeptidase N
MLLKVCFFLIKLIVLKTIVCLGFAKWFEYLATDYIVPEYNVFSEFFSTQFVRYFDYCVNILHNEADDIDEKDFSFEGFIYSKGSCLMRMLHLFIGQNSFLDSIRLFLQRYSYQTATAIDFWTCVEETTELPISKNKDLFFFNRLN